MHISHVEISNFRALQSVSVPLNTFSVLLGENDVGKTSFLHALDKYFIGKKLNDPFDWFKSETNADIRIVLTFQDAADDELNDLYHSDGSIVVSKVFQFDKPPQVKAVLGDGSAVDIPKPILSKWSSERFHFIPVRRDLAVQFSMAKTALLGKTLRARMKKMIAEGDAKSPLEELQRLVEDSIAEPRATLEKYLQQLGNGRAGEQSSPESATPATVRDPRDQRQVTGYRHYPFTRIYR